MAENLIYLTITSKKSGNGLIRDGAPWWAFFLVNRIYFLVLSDDGMSGMLYRTISYWLVVEYRQYNIVLWLKIHFIY